MAVGDISVTLERSAAVDYVYPFHIEPVSFFMLRPEALPRWLVIAAPFDASTWLLLLLALLCPCPQYPAPIDSLKQLALSPYRAQAAHKIAVSQYLETFRGTNSAGLVQHWMYEDVHAADDHATAQPLTVDDLSAAFLALAAGAGLATVSFFLEVALGKRR
ncbi:hypothetical protein FJT64_012363 [Amphibalanus amphitrite]|uniref:Uncharacterized protein n=1 Tax=Amphibalanus amphitrite TaxID=1232801 RepID=A0A6A4VCX0_AMPAM|nr:hypothetical protein FJT64_012363 [Amphibalanus amphitrite]